jgi:hypothetical protein
MKVQCLTARDRVNFSPVSMNDVSDVASLITLTFTPAELSLAHRIAASERVEVARGDRTQEGSSAAFSGTERLNPRHN